MQLPDPKSPDVADAYGEVRRTPEHERETSVEVRCANCVKKLGVDGYGSLAYPMSTL
jgi:hypothetical protein